MPPPSSIGSGSPTALMMSRITFSFLGRPAIAPFRSTMCRRFAPCASQCFAIATGSSENTVAESIRPCCSRTQRPSFKSIAGMISTDGGKSGTPAHEVGEKLQAGGLAFFRVELDGKNVIAGHRAGKGHPVDAGAGGERAIRGRGKVAVHEIEPAAVADSGPQRMRLLLDHLVPSHVRDLEAAHLGRSGEARHAPRQHAEPRGVAFLRPLEEHLQADADAEEGLVARR